MEQDTQEKSGKGMVSAFLEGNKRAEAYEKEMASELKPCPFCGGKARVLVEENYYDRPGEYYHNIYCIGCGAQMFVASRSEAVSKWNRRQNE